MARITVEDALKVVPNRFGLIHVVTKRAKQLLAGAKVLTKQTKENKAIVTAIREIEDGLVRFMTADEVAAKKAKEVAEEQQAVAAITPPPAAAPIVAEVAKIE